MILVVPLGKRCCNRSPCTRLPFVAGLVTFGLLFVASVAARVAVSQTLPADVRDVLKREAAGEVIDRRDAISSDVPASRWQRGIVMQEGKPVEFENLQMTPFEQEYRKRRPALMSDLEHLELAQWCESQRQHERVRAHLQVLIRNQPNDTALRSLLGHSLIDGQWFSPYQRGLAKESADERAEGLVTWLPKVSRIVQQSTSRSSAVKRKALAGLAAIDDPQAIYALEALVYESPAATGKLLVNKLVEFSSVRCCLALVRLALDDAIPPTVANLAEKQLVRYDRDLYVPELLSLLQVNQLQTQLITMPTGDLVLNTLVVRELQNRKEVMRLRKYFVVGEPVESEPDYDHRWLGFLRTGRQKGAFHYGDPNLNRLANAQQHWMVSKERRRWYKTVADNSGFGDNLGFRNYGKQGMNPFRGDIRADEAAFAGAVKTDQIILNSQLERGKERVELLNRRVIRLLHRTQSSHSDQEDALVTSLPSEDSDVQSWWKWWAEGNDQFVGIKELSEQRALIIEGEPNPSPLRRGPAGRTRGFCFVAGTPIQSSRSLVPIEDLAIGDLVLSQEVESGELALKPVLEILRRPESEVFQIAIGSEKITSTAGHFWWVVGKGWLRTRELQAGMHLRTARSVVRVDQTLKLPLPSKSYNLRVADFGTLFVGDQRVLCTDNEFPRPSMRSVPGYGNVGL